MAVGYVVAFCICACTCESVGSIADGCCQLTVLEITQCLAGFNCRNMLVMPSMIDNSLARVDQDCNHLIILLWPSTSVGLDALCYSQQSGISVVQPLQSQWLGCKLVVWLPKCLGH